MKLKNSVFFIILVITLFLFPVCKSEPVEENMEQEKEVTQEASPWKIAKGAEVDTEAFLEHFNDWKEEIIKAYGEDEFGIVGNLFQEKGTIIYLKDDAISGVDQISIFFRNAKEQGLKLAIDDQPYEITIGMIKKTVWGEWKDEPGVEKAQPINMFARIRFKTHLNEVNPEGKTLKNDTYDGEGTFLHRHGCPWDG